MRKPFKWVFEFRIQHTRTNNIYGHHSIGNGETLNIFEQGTGIISHALQEVNLAASSGNRKRWRQRGQWEGGYFAHPLVLPRQIFQGRRRVSGR